MSVEGFGVLAGVRAHSLGVVTNIMCAVMAATVVMLLSSEAPARGSWTRWPRW